MDSYECAIVAAISLLAIRDFATYAKTGDEANLVFAVVLAVLFIVSMVKYTEIKEMEK